MPALSITETQALATLRSFLQQILPAGVPVIRAQINRVPEPLVNDFVVMTPMLRERLATNTDAFLDCKLIGSIAPVGAAFTGSIAGAVLTVSAVTSGSIAVGMTVSGAAVASNTTIAAQLTGAAGGVGTYQIGAGAAQTVLAGTVMAGAACLLTVSSVAFGSVVVGAPVYGAAPGTLVTGAGTGAGDVGTYVVSPSQTMASGTLYAGTAAAKSPIRMTVQLDVHGPSSADNAQLIATILRDPSACDAFAAFGLDIQPLYASDPRQMPFINAERQYEFRWSVDAVMQINPVVTMPQQFAGQIAITLNEIN